MDSARVQVKRLGLVAQIVLTDGLAAKVQANSDQINSVRINNQPLRDVRFCWVWLAARYFELA